MTAVRTRRRISKRRHGLTAAERFTLMTGHPLVDPSGRTPFWSIERDPVSAANVWTSDLRALERAWRAHREELVADAGEHGLIPWAGREFEGMAGSVSPYEHLRVAESHPAKHKEITP
jgi:hypothetical protein